MASTGEACRASSEANQAFRTSSEANRASSEANRASSELIEPRRRLIGPVEYRRLGRASVVLGARFRRVSSSEAPIRGSEEEAPPPLAIPATKEVLLGESPECEVENAVPSKSGLLTVLEVLKIQMKFWPTLESIFSKLESRWGTFTFPDRTMQPPWLTCDAALLLGSTLSFPVAIRLQGSSRLPGVQEGTPYSLQCSLEGSRGNEFLGTALEGEEGDVERISRTMKVKNCDWTTFCTSDNLGRWLGGRLRRKGESSALPLAKKVKMVHNKKTAKQNVASFQPAGLETKCDLEMEKEKIKEKASTVKDDDLAQGAFQVLAQVLGSGQGILGVICGLEGVLDHAWWFLIIDREFPVRCTSDLRLSITNLLVVACDAILFGRDITQLVPECSALPTKTWVLMIFPRRFTPSTLIPLVLTTMHLLLCWFHVAELSSSSLFDTMVEAPFTAESKRLLLSWAELDELRDKYSITTPDERACSFSPSEVTHLVRHDDFMERGQWECLPFVNGRLPALLSAQREGFGLVPLPGVHSNTFLRILKNDKHLSVAREMTLFSAATLSVSLRTSLIILGDSISSIALIFSGFTSIPVLLTRNPRNFPAETPKAHLARFCIILYLLKTPNVSSRSVMWF
ncbi:hypothetical protein Acr_00g0070290 [Actinidia rufa]|uniref:Uncharacterized protein n=1 Tax=Actinidia rufa TaxID=165716 RepID=A0A7J0DR61_9ERIC|nr:hypothetical protein Acr_00g0070290 [Actinidia rufa]